VDGTFWDGICGFSWVHLCGLSGDRRRTMSSVPIATSSGLKELVPWAAILDRILLL